MINPLPSFPLKIMIDNNDIDIPNKLYFRIGEVAKLLGVDAHVLRYWESELELQPHRSNSGQRLYRKPEITLLFKIKDLVHNQGYTIAGAKKSLQEQHQPTVSSQQVLDILQQMDRLQQQLHSIKTQLQSQ